MSNDNATPAPRGRKPRAENFYRIGFDYARSDTRTFVLENILSLAPEEKVLRPIYGQRGFPDCPEAPRFLFGKKAGRMPRDLELVHAYWLVSDRTKSVFEAMDPEGFAFLACDVRLPQGKYTGPRYWLCDVVRVLDALDEARSRLKIGTREDKAYRDFGKKYYELIGLGELVFRKDAIGGAHVFRMAHMEGTSICDQAVKDACKAAGLKGIRFDDTSKI